jgi:hypothetical protein
MSDVSRPRSLGRIALGAAIGSLATIPLIWILTLIADVTGRRPVAYWVVFGGVVLLTPLLAISAVVIGHVSRRRYSADHSARSALIIGYSVLGLAVLLVAVWLAWSLVMIRSL